MILDNVREDRELYDRNPDAYERVSIRLEDIIGNQKKVFMGEEFNHTPLPLKEKLISEIEFNIHKLTGWNQRNTPNEFQLSLRDHLNQLQMQLENNQYAVTKPEFDYIENYSKKEQEYFDTQFGDYDEIVAKLIQEEYQETAVV
jgi:hypothetical protein